MAKPILRFFWPLLILVTFPFVAYCQLPSAKWVDDIGGPGDSKATGMITDKSNNIYVTGFFSGTVDFDPSPSKVKNLTSVGGYDIYVAKYAPDGTLIWAVSMGGNALDQANCMTVDANGNPTIVGQYQSSTLTAGSLTFHNAGAEDIFIIHLDTNGNILWGKSLGGPDTDRGEEVSSDAQGNIIVTSIFQSTISINSTQLTAIGNFNGLIIKYDASGNLLWYVNLGNNSDNELYGDQTDANGNIFVSGSYSGTLDFDPNGVHHNITSNGLNNPFVAKYTSAGKLIWVSPVSGSVTFNSSVITVDPLGNVYFTGAFTSSLVFNQTTTLNTSGNQDTFLAKYAADGTFQYARDLGGVGASSFPYQIRTDQTNNVYVTGYFGGSIDFNPSPSQVATVSSHGQRDFYLAKYDTNGNYIWAFGGGSAGCDNTFGIELAIDNNNDVVLGGAFCQTVNFDPSTCGALSVTAQNSISDTYIAKYNQVVSSVTQITAFSIPQQLSPAVIDQSNHIITVQVAYGSNIKALAPAITVSAGIVTPASGVAEDFTSAVTYSLVNGCSTVNYTVRVNVAPAPKAVTVCSGSSNILTGDTETPVPNSFVWQLLQNNAWVNAPGTYTSKDYQTAALLNTSNANVVFSLRRQTTTGGSLYYDSFYDVTVQPSGAITNNTVTAPTILFFCQNGDPAIINGSTPTGGNGTYTYQWQSSADNVTFKDIPGATVINYDPPAINATTYFRRTVISGSCTGSTESNVITIVVQPALANNTITPPSVTAFCSTGDPGIITGSTPSGGSNTFAYQWQSSTDNITFTNIAGATAVNYDPPLLNATTYYQRSVTSGACTVPLISNVVTITISSNPTMPTSVVSPAVICAGNAATLSVASPQAGVTYDWYDSATKSNHLFTGTIYTTPVLNASTAYYVQASNNSCISALGIFQVTVNGLPASPVVTKNAVAVCSGSTATLTISNPQAGSTYNWYNAASGGTTVFTGTSFVTPAVIASTTYYAEAVNSTGCVSASRTAVGITVNQLPVASAVGVAICPGASAQLTAISNDQNASITWYANASGGSALFTGNTFNTPALNTGTTYYIEATDNTTGCVSNTRGPVEVTIIQPLAAPVVSAGTATTSTVTFDWTAVNGATGYQVSIDGGKTFIAPSSGSAGLSHTVSGLQSGQSVTIIVEALGSSACQLSANSTAVTALALSPLANQIFVPNAFTPNGDGKNDIVYVHSEFIKTIKFYIYDQWGELLFTSLNQANGWDGTYKGNKEPVGVYVYYVEATMNDGQIVNKKGTVTLLR